MSTGPGHSQSGRHAQLLFPATVDELCSRSAVDHAEVCIDLDGAVLAGATDAQASPMCFTALCLPISLICKYATGFGLPGTAHAVVAVHPASPPGLVAGALNGYKWQPVSGNDVQRRVLCGGGAEFAVKNGELQLPPRFELLVDGPCCLERLVVRGAAPCACLTFALACACVCLCMLALDPENDLYDKQWQTRHSTSKAVCSRS
jgi:hypothetical protein